MKLIVIILILYSGFFESCGQNNSQYNLTTESSTLDSKLLINSSIFNKSYFTTPSNVNYTVSVSPSINSTYNVSTSSTASSLIYPNKSIELYEVNDTYYSVNFIYDNKLFNDWGSKNEYSVLNLRVLNSISLKHIPLQFQFAFYGHPMNSVIVTSAGFVYMSDFLHQYMTFSQYIAPFMVQLQMKQETSGVIKYKSTENYFQILWENMRFKHDSNFAEYGNVTFSAILMKNGSILFIYYQVPKILPSTVTIGLSDAFYEDFEALNLRRIVLYSKISILNHPLSQSMILFTPKTVCNQLLSCGECLSAPAEMKCQWCDSLKHCSNGYDRLRQKWLKEKCNLSSNNSIENCSILSTAFIVIITIFSIISIVLLGIAIFICRRKYKDPSSGIGRFFLENRPSNIRERFSQIKFRRDIPYSVTLQ